MADYQGKYTGAKVDEAIGKALEDHGKLSALEQKVENLNGADPEQISAAVNAYLQANPIVGDFADKSEIVNHTDATLTLSVDNTLNNNKLIVCQGAMTSINLSGVSQSPYEVVVMFMTGADVSNILTMPSTSIVAGEINIEANKAYALSVLGGVIACGELTINA